MGSRLIRHLIPQVVDWLSDGRLQPAGMITQTFAAKDARDAFRLAIHADDPPWPLMGLTRIASSLDDLRFVTGVVPSAANGITRCTGSLGAGPDKDVPPIAPAYAEQIHFVDLRNVSKEPDGSFVEAEHLAGGTDMVAVVETLLAEQARRRDAGDATWRLPFRPDHGHELLDDVGRNCFPGYSAIGRLKGLAEIRGVMRAVARLRLLPITGRRIMRARSSAPSALIENVRYAQLRTRTLLEA